MSVSKAVPLLLFLLIFRPVFFPFTVRADAVVVVPVATSATIVRVACHGLVSQIVLFFCGHVLWRTTPHHWLTGASMPISSDASDLVNSLNEVILRPV